MAKKNNLNSKSLKVTNLSRPKKGAVSPWFDDYKNLLTFRLQPITEAFIDRLAFDMNEWSLKEDTLILKDFCDERGIPPTTMVQWRKRHQSLEDAWELARRRIVSRREKGMLKRTYDPTTSFNSLAKYDADWKEFLQWKASLTKDDMPPTTVVVHVKKDIENEEPDKDSKG